MSDIQELWGTFSVKDHVRAYPFVSDVLLFDKLVIPRKPVDEDATRKGTDYLEWPKRWNPGRLVGCLEALGDLAVPVDWTQEIRQEFNKRAGGAPTATTQTKGPSGKRDPGETRAYDPFYETRLKLWDLPQVKAALVGKGFVAPIAAYPSMSAFRDDYGGSRALPATADRASQIKEIPANELGSFVGHRFLTPSIQLGLPERLEQGLLERERELLLRAKDLAKDPVFQEQRANFRARQRQLVGLIQGQSGSKVVGEADIKKTLDDMAKQISEYNAFMAKALKEQGIRTRERFEFKLVEVGAPVGVLIGGMLAFNPLGLVAAAVAGAAAPLISFMRHERKLELPTARPGESAAMFLTASPIVHYGTTPAK